MWFLILHSANRGVMLGKMVWFGLYVLDRPIFAHLIIQFYAERFKLCKWFFWKLSVTIFLREQNGISVYKRTLQIKLNFQVKKEKKRKRRERKRERIWRQKERGDVVDLKTQIEVRKEEDCTGERENKGEIKEGERQKRERWGKGRREKFK